MITLRALLCLAVLIQAASVVLAQTGDGFDLSWSTTDSGETTVPRVAGDFTLEGTLGQPDAGTVLGGDFFLSGGFWPGFSAACGGDCNGDAVVTVDELVTLVNVALGSLPSRECGAGDRNGDGAITIEELVFSVNSALDGC